MAIFNKYKDTLDNFIDNSDPESLNKVRLIDERSYNVPRSENSLTDLWEGDCLDEDILDRSSRLAPKTENSQMRQCYVVALFQARFKRVRGEEKTVGEIK